MRSKAYCTSRGNARVRMCPDGVKVQLMGLRAWALFLPDCLFPVPHTVPQAAPATSLTIPRAYDSTLLALKSPSRANSATGAPSPSAGTAPRQASLASAAAGVEGGGGAAGVCDLHAAELSSPAMVEVLNAVRKQSGHDGWVGLQRYLMHLPTLHCESWRRGGGGGTGQTGQLLHAL